MAVQIQLALTIEIDEGMILPAIHAYVYVLSAVHYFKVGWNE